MGAVSRSVPEIPHHELVAQAGASGVCIDNVVKQSRVEVSAHTGAVSRTTPQPSQQGRLAQDGPRVRTIVRDRQFVIHRHVEIEDKVDLKIKDACKCQYDGSGKGLGIPTMSGSPGGDLTDGRRIHQEGGSGKCPLSKGVNGPGNSGLIQAIELDMWEQAPEECREEYRRLCLPAARGVRLSVRNDLMAESIYRTRPYYRNLSEGSGESHCANDEVINGYAQLVLKQS